MNGFAFHRAGPIWVDPACNNNCHPDPLRACSRTWWLGISPVKQNVAPSGSLTNIMWLNDGGTFNQGWLKMEGIDWTASYDWDMGDLGAWNAGIAGTYYLHPNFVRVPSPGTRFSIQFHTTSPPAGGVAQNGVVSSAPENSTALGSAGATARGASPASWTTTRTSSTPSPRRRW